MRILVTGGAGFIGSHFARYLLDSHPDYTVIVYDKLTYAGLLSRLDDLNENFRERFSFVQGDICDDTKVKETLQSFNVDTIVNFAAESHVDRSLDGPHLFVHTNVLGTSVIMESAVRCGIQRVVHIGTDEVYGEISFGSVSEGAPLSPRNLYAASKAGADEMVMAYHATFGLNVSITRSSNNYGPWQHPEKFIAKSIIGALLNKPIQLHSDGQHMRDWLWVIDNCKAIDLVLHKGSAGELYNIGSGQTHTNRHIAGLMLQLLGLNPGMIEYIPDRKSNDRRYLMNTANIRALGWKPDVPLEDGLSQTIEWYQRMKPWWECLLPTNSNPTGESLVNRKPARVSWDK